MKRNRTWLAGVLAIALVLSTTQAATVRLMPDVTEEMTQAAYWADKREGSREVILTPEEIQALNQDTALASGTMVMDLKSSKERFDGLRQNQAITNSATADAQYYFGWTYSGQGGEKATWDDYQAMIDNCTDPTATEDMPVRYGVAVKRTTLRVFPSFEPILDDPKDPDYDYQNLSAVQVNDPVLVYTTSADGQFYLARSRDCSGWLPAEDVAVCQDKEEWLSAWDLPAEQLLVVYGSKVYTDSSNSAPDTAHRMLCQGTAVELAGDLEPDSLVNNRSGYHNYIIYLPHRRDDGSYEKQLALVPKREEVNVGYLPLTEENIAMVALATLGDAYGWGGMLENEDCSGMIRTIYSCFGLHIGRNGNWQFNMNIEKMDLTYMSVEEKCKILDELPIGAALCFSGHEMMYLGKDNGKYYVVSTVSSIISPTTGKRLRTRDVMINTLDVKRANGLTWLQALNKAFMPCYDSREENPHSFPQTMWYHEGVAYCWKEGILTNLSDGTFGIGQTVDRTTLAQALWVMAGKPEADESVSFADVTEQDQAYQAICFAAEKKLMTGGNDGLFHGDGTLTREQLATVLKRFDAQSASPLAVSDGCLSDFSDEKAASPYAEDGLRWAYGGGLLTGTAQGQLLPQAGLTREQLAVILERYASLSQGENPAIA